MNGGNGSTNGITQGKAGGSAGNINTSGANAVTDVGNGGTGGSISTIGLNTNSGGSLITQATTSRKGGSLVTFWDSYSPCTLFTTTSSAGPSASSAETSLLGTATQYGSAGKTIKAYVIDHAGRTVLVDLWGTIATSGTPTLDVKFKIGGTAIIDTGAQTLVAVNGTQTWHFQGMITFRTTGASGACIGQGKMEYFSNATTVNAFSVANTATTTIDTTVDEAVDCTAQFSDNETLTCTSAHVQIVN